MENREKDEKSRYKHGAASEKGFHGSAINAEDRALKVKGNVAAMPQRRRDPSLRVPKTTQKALARATIAISEGKAKDRRKKKAEAKKKSESTISVSSSNIAAKIKRGIMGDVQNID